MSEPVRSNELEDKTQPGGTEASRLQQDDVRETVAPTDGVNGTPADDETRIETRAPRKGQLIVSLLLAVLFGVFLISDLASGSYARAAFGVVVEVLCLIIAYREIQVIRAAKK